MKVVIFISQIHNNIKMNIDGGILCALKTGNYPEFHIVV